MSRISKPTLAMLALVIAAALVAASVDANAHQMIFSHGAGAISATA